MDWFQVENFRAFRRLVGTLHPTCTVLYGENGQGKSAVLDALAIGASPFIAAFDHGRSLGFQARDARVAPNDEPQFPISLELRGALADVEFSSRRVLQSPKSRTTVKESWSLARYGEELQQAVRGNQEVTLPVLAYYGTSRLWRHKRVTQKKLRAKGRGAGYLDCLDPDSNFEFCRDWFLQKAREESLQMLDDLGRGQQPQISHDLGPARFAVDTLLQPFGASLAHFHRRSLDEVVLRMKSGATLEMSQLSDGIRGVLSLAMDLAVRCTKLNPHLGEHATTSPGFVLVDEIELHLHPSWQQRIIHDLRTTFPKIQWVFTTHSPQILTTLSREEIRHFAPYQDSPEDVAVVEPAEQADGWSSDGALANLMGVDPYPPTEAVKEIDAALTAAYTSPDFKPVLEQITGLKQRYGATHPKLVQAELAVLRRQAK